MKIKDRALGADIPSDIKQKLALRQELNRSVDVNEAINNVETRYGGRPSSYEIDFKDKDGKRALADLSSRTPFVRMWVALQTYTMNEAVPCWPAGDTAVPPAGMEECKTDSNYAIFRTFKGYWNKKIKKSSQGAQIYQIGNHVLNMLTNTDVNESIAPIDETGAVMPELASNPFFKPQSGILSLSSETQSASSGPIGTRLSTTVNFVVHNFQDFEKIYRPYFLRPGALVFIDYGWSTADLYDPEKLKFDIDDIEDKILGFIEEASGDLDIIMGYVQNYEAKIKENGSVECSITVVSQNSALVDVKTNTELISVLARAVTDNTPESKYMKWGDFEDKVLNPSVGFAIPSDKFDVKVGPRFNSSGSYARYVPELAKDNKNFKYPDTWDSIKTDTEVPEHKRIPVRDLLFHHDVLHPTEGSPTIANNASINNYIDGILNHINGNNDELIKLEKYSNTYVYTTISICDSNYLLSIDSGVNDSLNSAGTTSSEFENFFMFKPGSPNSIVKTYDLSFTMPQGDLQNRIAIKSRSSEQGFFPVHNKMDQLLASEVVEIQHVEQIISGYAEHLPTFPDIPTGVTAGEDKKGPDQRAKNEVFTKDTSPITWLNLTLTIYGISSLAPGDLFRVDYLPGYHLDNTFFRITGISHDISPSTWTTTLTTIQCLLYKAKHTDAGLLYKSDPHGDISDDNPSKGAEDNSGAIGGTSVEAAKENAGLKEALCGRLMNIGLECTSENLNVQRIEKLEAEFKKNEGIHGQIINLFGHCHNIRGKENRLEYPVFDSIISKKGDTEASRVLGEEGYEKRDNYDPLNYIDGKRGWISSPGKKKKYGGIYLLNNLRFDCDVKIYGEASKGCDTSTGLAGLLPCEYKGYGHNKKIEKLWREAIPSGSTAGEIGKYTTGKHWMHGIGIAELKKGQSYYLIRNISLKDELQRNILAPAQANFNAEDYDFNIGWGRHMDTYKKCEYGWEENYECSSTYDWTGAENITAAHVQVNEKDGKAVVDWDGGHNIRSPGWSQFTSKWAEYFYATFGYKLWEFANYTQYAYFIDCNPTSDCYHKAFSVTSSGGKVRAAMEPMRILNFKTGETKVYGRGGYAFLRGSTYTDETGQYYPGTIDGILDGVANVVKGPFCDDWRYSTDDGKNMSTIKSSFNLEENAGLFEKNEGFDSFCKEFNKYGPNPPSPEEPH